MKTRRIIFTAFAIFTVLGRGAEDDQKNAKAGPVHVEDGKVVVSLEAQKRNDFQFTEIKPAELAQEISAFGTIVDPTPLLLLETELKDAQAASLIASNQLQRARTLFQDDQTVSRRTLETAENQLRLENTRKEVAQRRIALEWGNVFASLSETNSQTSPERLLTHKVVLARLELPIGQHLPPGKSSLRLRQAGADQWHPAAFLGFAPVVDVRSQGESFLARIDNPPDAMRNGSAVEGRISYLAAAEKGWRIPAGAVLRYFGEHWIYIKEGEDRFEKKQITLDRRDDDGWFTKTSFEPGTICVVQGGSSLLSAELQAAFGGEPE